MDDDDHAQYAMPCRCVHRRARAHGPLPFLFVHTNPPIRSSALPPSQSLTPLNPASFFGSTLRASAPTASLLAPSPSLRLRLLLFLLLLLLVRLLLLLLLRLPSSPNPSVSLHASACSLACSLTVSVSCSLFFKFFSALLPSAAVADADEVATADAAIQKRPRD